MSAILAVKTEDGGAVALSKLVSTCQRATGRTGRTAELMQASHIPLAHCPALLLQCSCCRLPARLTRMRVWRRRTVNTRNTDRPGFFLPFIGALAEHAQVFHQRSESSRTRLMQS